MSLGSYLHELQSTEFPPLHTHRDLCEASAYLTSFLGEDFRK